MKTVKFTVDSALLKELGERLVGRQYIALAELIKNSFDADAEKVEITIREDSIEVSDNGHGMTVLDFTGHWMRVGSTHKVDQQVSPKFQRPLTGSKGIGRLAVQFLAREMEMISVPSSNQVPEGQDLSQLYAMVDWETAVEAGELTSATATYDLTPPDEIFPMNKSHGTKVFLNGLKHDWGPDDFEDLAREVWFLQPPFRALSGASSGDAQGFEVQLHSPDPVAVSLFEAQISRILDLYSSRIVGELLPSNDYEGSSGNKKVKFSLELEGSPPQTYEYEVPVQGDGLCLIDKLDFEIRIYTLQQRQPYGIAVKVARDYMAEWGGVHIYDSGFRIPIGGPYADWLRLEFDHSHRLTQSQLLPPELNLRQGLNFLPTNSRVLGVVNIDTTNEARVASNYLPEIRQHLQIQVSRDRLVSNNAFQQLRDAIRYAIDHYSTRLAVLRLEEKAAEREVGTPSASIEGVWDLVERYEAEMPKSMVAELRVELDKTLDSVREQAEWTSRQSGLLAAMATAGMTAIAFQHQFNQQLSILEQNVSTLDEEVKAKPELQDTLGQIVLKMRDWIRNARATRALFSPIEDERNRTAVTRFIAKPMIAEFAANMKVILRNIDVDVSGVSRETRLPLASFPQWMAVFHNVFLNASNAMLDSDVRHISVSSFNSNGRRGLHVQDTGAGIDLLKSEELFEPLKRAFNISPERRMLGYGGTGLGLAIVRMVAKDMNADVRFVKPKKPFNTCFEISWGEQTDE